MNCPCRLASGDREADRDIICPCDYREPDVKEYGSCYCNLYVSKEWNEGTVPNVPVPERRPIEKVISVWPGGGRLSGSPIEERMRLSGAAGVPAAPLSCLLC